MGLPIPITPQTVRVIMTALSMAPELIADIRAFVERFVPDQGQRLDAVTEFQRIVARARGEAVQTTVEAAPEAMRPQSDPAPAQEPVKPKSWLSGAQATGRTDPAWWRPAMGRFVAYGMLYAVIGQPVLEWLTEIARVAAGANLPGPPAITIAQIVGIVGGGGVLAALRTIEKTKGVAG